MIRKRYGYWIVCWLLSLMSAYAQTTTYPLQVNANVVPPYSLYLSDYYSGTRDRLSITLINRDQLTPTVNVRLRMIITAAGGIRIQTNESAFIQPLVVEAGSPVRLTQEDLAPYFQPDNIITQGFLSAGKMPEGMVEFCFQAIEAYTGRVLSASTCTRAWITSQKPPLLSLPRNDESIAFREPLNVLFQWTPLHQGLAQVEYDFILKELWDNGMTPQAAFPYSPEIYRETTRSTSIVYGALQPPLLPGKRYAWCVQAKARDGMEELNVFQNNGYSEIRWFKLQDNCQPLELVEATAERKRVTLAWTPLPEHIGFTINYREKSKTDQQNEWKESSTQQTQTTLYGLKAGAIYEYRVGSVCMSGQPIYTPIMEVLVPAADSARTGQCGLLPAVNLQNQELIGELKPQEVFQVGDFPVTVVRCSGGKGSLTGVGWTIIPWLNDAKMAVEFNNIAVNTDRQMTQGVVRAIYDEKAGQIANLDDAFVGGFDQGLVKTGLTKTDTTFDFSIPGVESFALGDDGSLIITDAGGEPHSIAMSDKEGEGNEGNKVKVFPMTVKDKDGNVYQVEKVTETEDGQEKETVKATKLGNIGAALAADSFDPTQLNADKAIVRFNKGTGKYSFDTWQSYYANILLIRDKYEKLHNDYYAAWKLLPGGENDDVGATIEIVDKTIDPTKVIFTTPQGTRYDATHNNGTYSLRVTSGPEGDVQELYALYPKSADKYYTLGKLSIATYAKQEREVVLVSVDNTHVDYEEVEKMLKSVYDSVGIHWTISRDAFAYNATGLMTNATGLSTYNDAMRALNNAYRAARPGFKSSANYVFFLKATGNTDINNRDLTGFMPRGSQFGYIFTSEVANIDEPITVAHELGHGRWKLYHPFDKTYGGYESAKKTNNLMAYGNDGHIAKWQWDQLADPAAVVSIFEGDARSEYALVKNVEELLPFANKDQAGKPVSFTFFARSGKPITLPINGLQSVAFSTGDQAACSGDKFRISPFGTLTKFVVKDDKSERTYVAYWDCNANRFDSYRSGDDVYYDKLTNASVTKAIFGLPAVVGGDLKFKATLVDIPTEPGVEKYTASGDYKAYDFLADKVNDIPESAYGLVAASFSPDFNVEVRQFILDNIDRLGWSGKRFYEKDIYVFTHATQLQKYGILTGCFRGGVPKGFFEAVVVHVAPTVENGIVLSSGSTLTGDDLIDHWAKYDVNYYPVLAKAVKAFHVPANATAEAAYDLLKPFATDNESGVLDCYWQTIPFEQRIQLVELLMPENEAFDRSEEIVQLLITTTPRSDQERMLEKLKGEQDEYAFFKEVWEVLDSDERIVLGYTLLSWLKTYDNQGPEYAENEYKHFQDVTLKTTTTDGTNDNFFLLYKTNWVEDVFIETFEVSLEPDNTVYIKYDGDPVEGRRPEFYNWQGKPFDWIVARIEEDFPKYDLKAGNYLVAPAVFFLAFDKHRDKQQNQAALRVFGDGLVIASVVVSGGGTTPLASAWFTVNATTAAIDIGVTVFREEIDAELGAEAGTYWDVLYGAVNLFSLGKTFIVPTAYKIANGINRISQFRLVINQVDNVAREIATYGNLSEKLTYLAQLDKLLNLLKASQFRKIAEARFLQWKLLELRFKVLRSFPDSAPFTELLIQDGNLTVGGQLSLGTAEFIENVPTLTGNIRWVPQSVASVRVVDQYEGIAVVVNGGRTILNLQVVEDLLNPGQFYVKLPSPPAQTPPLLGTGGSSTTSSLVYQSDYATHLTDVAGFSQQKAITGGHNLANFENYLVANSIVINRQPIVNSTVQGVFELSYQIRKADGSGWKSANFRKTLYDPAVITDAQMIQFGKEAMMEGLAAGRTTVQAGSNTIIKGQASNGLKFYGYQDPVTKIIKNFHPVIVW